MPEWQNIFLLIGTSMALCQCRHGHRGKAASDLSPIETLATDAEKARRASAQTGAKS
jgi:hypothetical protein